jgi:hypothetical protein
MTLQNIKNFTTIRPAVIALAALCFLLPMFNIKCSSPMGGEMKIANISGGSLIIGGSINTQKDFEGQMKKNESGIFDKSVNSTSKKDIKSNIFAIISLICTIAALIFCFLQFKNKNLFVGIASGLCFLCLVILAFTIKKHLGFIAGTKESLIDVDLGILMVEPAIGFYLISLFLLTAATISYLFYKNEQEAHYAKTLEAELLQTEEENKSAEDNVTQIVE